MTLDQIYTLIWDRKKLLMATGGIIIGTESELASMGALPEGYQRGGKSVAQEAWEAEERYQEVLRVAKLKQDSGKALSRREKRAIRKDRRIRRRQGT